jgi:hemoglobin
MDARSIYERAGGDAPFRLLVDIFYRNVEATPLLRPMFPADLAAGKEWQFLFITQYFGGPTRYIEQRGHPRLRMRHGPFVIGQAESDAWLECMLSAMDDVGFAPDIDEAMRTYFASTARFMINSDTDSHRISLGANPT